MLFCPVHFVEFLRNSVWEWCPFFWKLCESPLWVEQIRLLELLHLKVCLCANWSSALPYRQNQFVLETVSLHNSYHNFQIDITFCNLSKAVVFFSTYFYYVYVIIHRIMNQNLPRIVVLLGKKPAYVLGYFEFVFLRKTWNVPIVKLQVCNLILLSAAALSNRKSDLLDF